MDDVLQKVRQIVADALNVEPEKVTPEASFIEDLGADSLDVVELVMRFEDELGINIPDEDAEKIATVGQSVEYIKHKLQQSEA